MGTEFPEDDPDVNRRVLAVLLFLNGGAQG
jgi:hypothetical protein